MKMKVRCFLSTKDTVVLKSKYSKGAIGLDERFCDFFCRDQNGRAFLIGQIQQRRDMPTRDNATLANLELPRIDDCQCVFAFIYDRPSFFAARHPFAKVAGISYGKLDQISSPIMPCFLKTARSSPDTRPKTSGFESLGRQ
jgi:hypothetical protein